MAIDPGREWALKTLGADGVLVRERIPAIIRDCHEKLANAQAEADMNHSGPYGYIWVRCLSEFSNALGGLPSAELVSLPRAGYKLVSFNGVVLFPWRYAKERSVDIASRPFAVSDARIALFTQPRDQTQLRLDIAYEHPELTDEERDFLDADSLVAEDKALQEALSTQPRVVVVAYASNPSSLHRIDWGEATLGEDGYLTFASTESLLDIGPGSLVDVNPAEDAFSDGPIPRPQLGSKEDESGGAPRG